jgi:hypothetical protein
MHEAFDPAVGLGHITNSLTRCLREDDGTGSGRSGFVHRRYVLRTAMDAANVGYFDEPVCVDQL